MTVRDLIEKLEEFDDDIKDYQLCITFAIQLNPTTRLTGKCNKIIVQDNADVSARIFWLKARQE
jgi:hypothetical protein